MSLEVVQGVWSSEQTKAQCSGRKGFADRQIHVGKESTRIQPHF